MRRSVGRIVLAAVFILLSLNAWKEVASAMIGDSESPALLTGLQALCGVIAAAVAWASWAGARWAPAVALLYGVVAGGMVAGLGPMLDLPAEARGGLWMGAAIILAFALVSAWWLRRSLRREGARESASIVS
jgi:hypothetical protein